MASIPNGSIMRCTFGLVPIPLALIPPDRPANINDGRPYNIRSFGMCCSPANPAVAATIAATRGTINKTSCIPIGRGPWTPARPMPGVPQMVGNPPAPPIDERSVLMCIHGGVISFISSPTASAASGSVGGRTASSLGSGAGANSGLESLKSKPNPPEGSRGGGA